MWDRDESGAIKEGPHNRPHQQKTLEPKSLSVYAEGALFLRAFFKQRFRWKFGRFKTFWKNRDLFFNSDPKYTKYLTFIYLPFQLYSELTFLFDPVFFIYILYLAILYMNPASYYGMFIFMMFFIMIAVVTDNESTVKRKIQLLSVSPLSYVIFFVVSAIEYAGLIKCVARWREIIYAERYNSCSWMPVERHG